MKRRIELLDIFAVCGIALIVAHILIWLPYHWTRDTTRIDFAGYYRAAQRLVAGEPVYTDGFFYPPSFLLLALPMVNLTFEAFQKVWYTLVLLGFWAYAWGLARLAFSRPTARHVLATGMLVAVTPGINYVLSFGNADIFVWGLAAWGLAEESPVLLLFGSAMKVYPIAAAWSLAVRRKCVGDMILVCALIGFATATVVGTDAIVEWLHTGGMPVSRLLFFDGNVSAPVLLLRALGCYDLASPLTAAVLHVVPVVVTVAAMAVSRRWSVRAQGAFVVLAVMWSAPICWAFREPLLWTAVAVWQREHGMAVAERIQGWWAARRARV